MIRIGLIINPIAGMGGRVGLKGTDGLANLAKSLGARPQAGNKVIRMLAQIPADSGVSLLTPPGKMGEEAAKTAGFNVTVLDMSVTGDTTGDDTRDAATLMIQAGVDLLVFAGGDGTARDVYRAVGEDLPVLGIPAGVKIHSPVFAQTPEAAGRVVHDVVRGRGSRSSLREVLDIDEALYRNGQVQTRLYGYLLVPESKQIQGRKAGTSLGERAAQNQICLDYLDRMKPDAVYLIGPGTTTRPVMENLGLEHSLLGVDVIENQKLIAKDVSEQELLELTKSRKVNIFITPIGGQGYLFGRGNHQISPEVIQQAGKDNIKVGATMEKIGSLQGAPFLLDTGCPETDKMLTGYTRVITGYRQEMIYPIA
ncbi:MAG: ATP-NAD kinase family protein [Desulfobacterales bacterium]|nr:ATP-NAD kinase family protein [Desulfobacterales bacterium]